MTTVKAFALPVVAALTMPVLAALEPQLPGGTTIACDLALKRVCLADRAVDEAWSACTDPQSLKARQDQVRKALLAALGGLPLRTPLNGRVTGRIARDGYVVEKVLFESRPNHHVTANLFLPDATRFPGKRPGVVLPCGHSTNGKGSHYYQRGAVKAALNGLVTLLYDPIDQGERRQSRQSAGLWNCWAHNNIGRRAELLGQSAATYRIWDGLRALDYLETRPEVDATKLGVMGHSGGGTMTSWIMCLDDRVAAAAPSGFLSTMRAVCEALGPQDAHQFVFGELAIGFNHLGHILLRAPSPVLMCTSHNDFFPFPGSLETAERARRVYSALGKGGNFRLSDTIGEHAWHESTSSYAVDWLCHTLLGKPLERTMDDYRAQQFGFDMKKVDTALAFNVGELPDLRTNRWSASATETGCTLDLKGERTVYDIMAEEAARQKAARVPLTPARVRALAGIRETKAINYRVYARHEKEGVDYAVLMAEDGTPVPVRTFGTGPRLLYVTETGNLKMGENEARQVAAKGYRVSFVDLRGFGETSRGIRRYYGVSEYDECLARLYALVGVNLVGLRAEDLIAAAKFVGTGEGVHVIARGRAAIAAAHAAYVSDGLIKKLKMEHPPVSWATLFEKDALQCRFADTVFGAWQAYDWTDLVR